MKNSFDIQGIPGETVRLAASDIAQTFTEAQYTRNGRPAIAVTLTCETEPIRLCLGGSIPTQGDAGLGHILYVGQSYRISNGYAIRSFRYINYANATNGFLQATFEFEIGG